MCREQLLLAVEDLRSNVANPRTACYLHRVWVLSVCDKPLTSVCVHGSLLLRPGSVSDYQCQWELTRDTGAHPSNSLSTYCCCTMIDNFDMAGAAKTRTTSLRAHGRTLADSQLDPMQVTPRAPLATHRARQRTRFRSTEMVERPGSVGRAGGVWRDVFAEQAGSRTRAAPHLAPSRVAAPQFFAQGGALPFGCGGLMSGEGKEREYESTSVGLRLLSSEGRVEGRRAVLGPTKGEIGDLRLTSVSRVHSRSNFYRVVVGFNLRAKCVSLELYQVSRD